MKIVPSLIPDDFIEVAEAVKKQKIVDGRIKNVHILGFHSKNNREYTKDAVKEAAPLYNGVEVYLNHESVADTSKRADNITGKFGYLDNCVYSEALGVVGDLVANTGHPYFEAISWWAQTKPESLGLSHIARVAAKESTNGSGKQTVVSIDKPRFVDLVSRPATTSSIFAESVQEVMEGMIADKIQEDRLSAIWSAMQSLYYRTCYPSYNYSAPQTSPLTDEQRAVALIPVLQDAIKELKLLAPVKSTTKESEMELKDITIDMLRKDRADLVSAIATEAVTAEKQIDAKVATAVKDLAESVKTAPILKIVRESIVRGEDVSEFVESIKAVAEKIVTSTATGVTLQPAKKIEAAESAPEVTEESLLAAFGV